MPETWEYEIGDTIIESDHELSPQEITSYKQKFGVPVNGRKMGWLEALGQGAMNLPGGLASNVGQIAQMAAGGAKMLVNPAHAAEVLTGAFQAGQKQGLGSVVGDIGRDYKQAYGGLENIKQTLANDPVRLLMDASMGLTGVGGVATKAGLSTAGRMATAAGRAIDPAMGAYKVGSKIARSMTPTAGGMLKESGRLWESGVKPSQSLQDKNNINFGIEGAKRGRIPDEVGMEASNTKRQALADAAKGMRKSSISAGETYQPLNVVKDVQRQKGKLGSQVGRVKPAKAAFDKAIEDFIEPRQRPITVASSVPSSARLQFGTTPLPVGQSTGVGLNVPPAGTVPTHRSGTWAPSVPAPAAPAVTVTGAPTTMPTPPPPVGMKVGNKVTQVPLTPALSLNTGEAITSNLGQRVQWAKKNPLTAGSQALSDEAMANEALYRASQKERNTKVDRGADWAQYPYKYEDLQKERGTEIALAKAMQQAVRREKNRNVLSARSMFGSMIGGGILGGLYGGVTGAATGGLAGAAARAGGAALATHFDNPVFKTAMAHRLYNLSQSPFMQNQAQRQAAYQALARSVTPGSILARLMSSHEQEP